MEVESGTSSNAVWRRDVYGILSFLYHRHPTDEDLDKILSLSKSQDGTPRVRNLLGCCAQWAKEENPQNIRQDFNDLFMVPASHYVTPYESVYADTSRDAKGRPIHLTFGPSTRKVQEFYKKIGLQISSDYTELPDYIGLELACMEYLCSREAELDSGSKDTHNVRCYQKQFLTEHLICWVPQLCQRIKNKAQTRFYRDLAEATDEFVMHDEHRFG